MNNHRARQAAPLLRDPMRSNCGLTVAHAISALVFTISMTGPVLALQTVTLNFDSISLDDPDDIYVYSSAERMAIKDTLEKIYLSDPLGGPFGIKFEIFDPLSPPIPFTTSFINFNHGFMGGAAEKLDFRNTDDNDDVDINAFGLLRSYEGAPKGLDGGTWTLPELTGSEAVVMASANLAAHELGHALGLRHHDSFGPIGSGIGVSGSSYDPVYIGPSDTNASFHVMGLASTVALNPETLLSPSWLSERSAMKLAFNMGSPKMPETGSPHGSPGMAQEFPFAPIFVANTQQGPPDPYYPDPLDLTPVEGFPGFAGAIIGATLSEPFEADYYVFDAPAGMRITIEAISKVIYDFDPARLPDPVDMKIELLNDTLSPIPYPNSAGVSINDNQFESSDSLLLDVVIPTSGTYFIEVSGSGYPGADVIGMYELYMMGFPDFPKPFLAGDLNGDCYVGIEDLNIVLGNWNADVTAGDLLSGDPNGDGFVGIADLNIVLGNWNAGDPPLHDANIPEPATLVLLSVSVGLMIARRR
ncbi:MAG: pre-peptidase C-terminal domain-containing protein [Phycisphaerales bacterium]